LAARLRPDPLGSYSAPPGPLATIRGPTSKGRQRDGRGREGREKGREGMKGEGGWCSQMIFSTTPVLL